MPPYPDGLALRSGQALVVCISFTVTDDGEVTDVVPAPTADPSCGVDDRLALQTAFEAVEATVRQWPFIAAAVCDYADAARARAAAEHGDETCQRALRVQAVPVRLAWRFVFHVAADGRGRVRALERGAP